MIPFSFLNVPPQATFKKKWKKINDFKMASLIKQLQKMQKMKTKALLNYLLTKNTFLKIVHYSVGLKMEKKCNI